jgi:asparagine synthase (glutamine-hydrolysing)
MCGITGIVDYQSGPDELKGTAVEMTNKLSHRGPDNMQVWADAFVALGHTRLKILDLSDDANQPFELNDCVLTYNGEIYNYRELRDQLQKCGYYFKSNSDTEVLVTSYICWGADCVNHFEGMWAFAIWDKAAKRLFCSRDRFGIKPFYYIRNDSGFYFGSEYKALKASPAFNGQINMNQFNRGLFLGWSNYLDESYYEQIKSLQPGHNLIVDSSGIEVYQYWSLPVPRYPVEELSFTEKSSKFFSLFETSVKTHARSDVEIGACLSGGLDSSSIVSMFCHLYPQKVLKTFTIYYSGRGAVDERPFANAVAEKFPNGVSAFFKSPDADDISEHFQSAAFNSEIPLLTSSFFSQYFVMRMAALAGVKVVLNGQGADECLGGYMHSFSRWLGDLLCRWKFSCAIKLFNTQRMIYQQSFKESIMLALKSVFMSLHGEKEVLYHEYKKIFSLMNDKSARSFPVSLRNFNGHKIDNFLYHLLFTTSLPTLLHYEDRNSMAFSIESRVPFLDHRLVEFLFSLPSVDKINSGAETKSILRHSMKFILPEKVRNRRDKVAFATPGEVIWLRSSLRHLLDLDYEQFYWLNPKALKKIINDYKSGQNNLSKLVWRLVTFNYWLKNVA